LAEEARAGLLRRKESPGGGVWFQSESGNFQPPWVESCQALACVSRTGIEGLPARRAPKPGQIVLWVLYSLALMEMIRIGNQKQMQPFGWQGLVLDK
jgi:hypothetical protein